MVAAAIVYPLEVVKTLLTVDRAKYKGILQGFALLIRETNSWFSLYRGLTPTLVAMFPYVGIEFAVYETLKIAIEARRAKAAGADAKAEDANLPTVALLLIGALAGALAQSSCHPLDVVRKRLQLQGLGGRPKLYHNMIHGIFGIARAEGVKPPVQGARTGVDRDDPRHGFVVRRVRDRQGGLRHHEPLDPSRAGREARARAGVAERRARARAPSSRRSAPRVRFTRCRRVKEPGVSTRRSRRRVPSDPAGESRSSRRRGRRPRSPMAAPRFRLRSASRGWRCVLPVIRTLSKLYRGAPLSNRRSRRATRPLIPGQTRGRMPSTRILRVAGAEVSSIAAMAAAREVAGRPAR